MRRFEFDGRYEERGGQGFASGRGAYGDAWSNITRIEPHGFMSMPVKGAKGLLLPVPGNPDQAYLIGGENPADRPKSIPQGGTAFYDHHGNVMKFIMGDGVVIDVAGTSYSIRKGASSVVVTADAVDINSPMLRHNGVNIGNTHIHNGVVPGSGNTGVPVG